MNLTKNTNPFSASPFFDDNGKETESFGILFNDGKEQDWFFDSNDLNKEQAELFAKELEREFKGFSWDDFTKEVFAKVEDLYLQCVTPACGLNASWSVEAWHIGPSDTPNVNDGDFYVIDNEDNTFHVVRRYDQDDIGENDIIQTHGEFDTFQSALAHGRKLVTPNKGK